MKSRSEPKKERKKRGPKKNGPNKPDEKKEVSPRNVSDGPEKEVTPRNVSENIEPTKEMNMAVTRENGSEKTPSEKHPNESALENVSPSQEQKESLPGNDSIKGDSHDIGSTSEVSSIENTDILIL